MTETRIQQYIRDLATLPETDAPVISCYVTLKDGALLDRATFDEQLRSLQNAAIRAARQDLADAIYPIETYLANELLPETKGLAVFSRAGDQPFFLPLQFHVALPNWIAADYTPNIFHLVEMKDTYHRYVVLICSDTIARILEINLGSVTAELWKQRPELRQRVGRKWSRQHYQNHRRNRADKFICEKVEILETLMSAGGHTHLILAGDVSITDRVRCALPKGLLDRLVGMIPSSAESPVGDVVEATIASFVAAKQKESHAAVDELMRQLRTGSLATAGTNATYRALYCGHADVVLIDKQYEPGVGWSCEECGYTEVEQSKPDGPCPECNARALREFDIKGAIVKMAERQGCAVEVVNESRDLQQLGGVGCLLRYRLSDNSASAASPSTLFEQQSVRTERSAKK